LLQAKEEEKERQLGNTEEVLKYFLKHARNPEG
jgi:hypothetical protein